MSEIIEAERLPAVATANAPQVTPMALVQLAIEQKADVDKLRALFELQRDWEKDQARKAYVTAFAKFKESPPQIAKNKKVFHGEKFMYAHATLDNVADEIGAALNAVGMSFRWEVAQQEGGKIKVTCVLTHEAGHSERVSMEASPDTSGAKNSIQAVGSTVSYLQRYTLLSATGVAVKGADDDGRGGKTGLTESHMADFKAAIDALADDPAAAELWKKITAATTAAGDVAANDELRTLMIAKRKALKK